MGPEVCSVVLNFLNSAHMEGSINSTNIVLIPKIKNLSSVSNFRPISLCNVVYELISLMSFHAIKAHSFPES